MKNLLLIGILMFTVMFANAQSISDTLQGNETVYFDDMNGAVKVSVLCTELGGTSDGSLYLQASQDGTNYVNVTETTNLFNFYPNDTLTITDGAVWNIIINDSPFHYYRVKGVGTASDTTLIGINYYRK